MFFFFNSTPKVLARDKNIKFILRITLFFFSFILGDGMNKWWIIMLESIWIRFNFRDGHFCREMAESLTGWRVDFKSNDNRKCIVAVAVGHRVRVKNRLPSLRMMVEIDAHILYMYKCYSIKMGKGCLYRFLWSSLS